MGLKVSVTSVLRLLKTKDFSRDFHRQAWTYRSVDILEHGAVSIREFFNPGTKERYYEPVYYTGNPAQYWKSKEFEDLGQAVAYINGHIEDAFHAYNDDMNTKYASHRVAKQYIKKACAINDMQNLPSIGSKIVKIDLSKYGEVTLYTDLGQEATVHTFDSRYSDPDAPNAAWANSKKHLDWKESEQRIARRRKAIAALVGTDSATIWAIAPESLGRLMEDPEFKVFLSNWFQGRDPEEMEDLWRRNGGAVFHTGADGVFDVKIPTPEGNLPIVNEEGYLPPYGTPE